MNILSDSLCGKIKVTGAKGIYGLSIDEIRKIIAEAYESDGKKIPSIKGLNRGQLCYLLNQTTLGKTLILTSQPQSDQSFSDNVDVVGIKSEQSSTSGTKIIPDKKKKISIKNKGDSIIENKPSLERKNKNEKDFPDKQKKNSIKNKGEPIIENKPSSEKINEGESIIENKPSSEKKNKTEKSFSDKNQLSIKSKTDCKTLGGLLNSKNSCYLDSTLLSLFFHENDFINKYILEVDLSKQKIDGQFLKSFKNLYDITQTIQNDLRTIKKNIRTGLNTYCTSLRSNFAKHQKIYQELIGTISKINWINADLEPIDVILRLNLIFQLPNPAEVQLTSYGTNNDLTDMVLTTTEDRMFSYKIIVDTFEIGKIKNNKIVQLNQILPLESFVNKTTINELSACNFFISGDKKKAYSKRIESIIFMNSPLLYIHISRVANNEMIGGLGKIKLLTPIIPNESIKMQNEKYLYLRAIIVHHGKANGGHYTAYLNCDKVWYHYNDAGFTKMIKIGSYDKLIGLNSNYVLSNGTDYLYM